MKKRSNRNGLKKERAVMVASTVLVLSALTVTGIYVRKDEKKAQDNGYTIDLSSLEQDEIMDIPEIAEESLLNDSDLDYDPDALEADSGDVTIGYGLKQDESIRKKSPTSLFNIPNSVVKKWQKEFTPISYYNEIE